MVSPIDIWVQAGAYGVLMVLVILVISALQRGFFWKYLQVRGSFGTKVLIFVRTPMTWYFAVGKVVNGMLEYKNSSKKLLQRPLIQGHSIFFRMLAVTWCAIDEETGIFFLPNFDSKEGYDAEKYSNLIERAQMQPQIGDNFQKVMVVLMIVCIAIAGIALFLSFKNYQGIQQLAVDIPKLLLGAKGTITQGAI